MSKYKVGDKVKIKRNLNWCRDILQAIDRLQNETATIKKVYVTKSISYYYMKEIGWN